LRTSVKNQWPALARGQGSCRRTKRWTAVGRQERERLALGSGASRWRQERLAMLDRLHPAIEELEPAGEKEAAGRAGAALLMRQPGVGPGTAWAFVRRLGPVTRFENSKQGVS